MSSTFGDLHSLYHHTLSDVHENFEYVNSPRGQHEREILGFSARLTNPERRYCLSRIRRQNIVFNYAEALWYLSGRNDLDTIAAYAPSMSRFSADGTTLPGTGYGPKLFRGVGGESALDRIITILDTDDPSSKRAVLQVFDDGEDLYRRNIDVSCTLALQLLRRDGRLHMIAFMRANDVYMGLLNDTFSFTFIQEVLASILGLELGVYAHHVGSIHIYDKDLPRVEVLVGEQERPPLPTPDNYPRIPAGTSLEQIRRIIDFEHRIRVGETTYEALQSENLPRAWTDILRLFWIHRQITHGHLVPRSVVAELHPLHRGLLLNRWPEIDEDHHREKGRS